MAPEQLGDIGLRHAILLDQRVDDPRFLQFHRFAGDAIQLEDGRLGALGIGLQQARAEVGEVLQRAGRAESFEAVHQHKASVEPADNDGRDLPILAQRCRHLPFEFRLD